jgi:hypothetical protein
VTGGWSVWGYFAEAEAMTILSRPNDREPTPLAIPVSEIRGSYAGEDAAVPFQLREQALEYGVDWKMTGASHTGPEVVRYGLICYEQVKLLTGDKPYGDDESPLEQLNHFVEYIARLLRDEGLDRRQLTVEELTLLDCVQRETWKTITEKLGNTWG